MPLVSTIELLRAGFRDGHGVGAFNVIAIEHAQAIVLGAELARSPVVLQVSQNAVRYNIGNLLPIGVACLRIAEAATVPVALHLDHASTWELCEDAIDLGFSSVMFDASHLPFEENVAETAAVARRVHARHRTIEAELGVVGGKDGLISSEAGNTDPELASQYVTDTGVDALAVAVGSSHYMVEQQAVLDLDLIDQLRRRVPVPLVLHGSSGVPAASLKEAVRRGIVKVNTATELNKAFTGAIRRHLAQHPDDVDPRTYLREARDAVADIVADRLALIGSAGRA